MTDRKRSYTTHFLLMAVLTAAALASVNFLAMEYRARLDLTADRRFTLSEGTEKLLGSLADPVVVTYYVDEEPPAKRINLERDVRDKLQELAASSNGKLEYKVERISNADVATKRADLEKKGINPVMDVLSTGSDESAAVRGIQGYYSSLEVRHGTAEPMVINGIVNLVDEMDESREHRVDTLEFDVTFSVLQMRSKGTRAPLKRMLKSLSEPVQVVTLLSEQMPASNPRLGQTIRDAMAELQRMGGPNVRYTEQVIPWGVLPNRQIAAYGTQTDEPTVDPNPTGTEKRTGPNFYFAVVVLATADREFVVTDLKDQTTVQQVLDRVDPAAYELVKPRVRLAFVVPPESMPAGPGQPPSPYQPLLNYVRGKFGYEILELNLAEQKRVPADVACVVVFEPNRLPARELYEVDRYLAQGGSVVFLFQGWHSKTDLGQAGGFAENLILNKVNVEPHFEEWAKAVGLEFGQDLLIHKRGKMSPYRIRGQRQELVPSGMPLAGVVDAGDVNGESVYGRGLSGMPLPFMVELKLDDAKVSAAGLSRQDIITLQDEVYRFIPDNPSFPQLPLRLNMKSPAEVEDDPGRTPDKGIRLHRLDHAPLVATSLRGQFKSFWAAEGRTVPAWEGAPPGDMLAGKAAPEVKGKPGSLVVVSSAGTLNIDYVWGYPQDDIEPIVIQRGITFYRNMVEAAIYGEDLASLRARTGVAPRIKGTVEPGSKAIWYALCFLGAPALLAAIAIMRLAARTRRRQEHEAAFSGGQP